MAAVSHQVRPGLRFQAYDFYYGEELDEGVIRTISEGSSSSYEDSSSDELDDETALAIAIQESLESAKLEESRRSYSHNVNQASTRNVSASASVTSSSSNSSQHRHSHSLTHNTTLSVGPSPRRTPSSLSSTSASTSPTSLSSSSSIQSFNDVPVTNTRSSVNKAPESFSRASEHPNVDEIAKLSRRSSMAAATRKLKSTLSRRSSRVAIPVPDLSIPPTEKLGLQNELKEYERLFFPKQFPACSRCGGRCAVLSSLSSQTHRHSTSPAPFKLHKHLHLTCTVPECGQTYCRGCFKPQTRSSCPAHCFSSSSRSEACPTSVSCCDVARLIGVFEVLKHLEETYLALASATSSHSTSARPSPLQRTTSQSGQWEDHAERIFTLLRSLLSFPSDDDDEALEEQEQFWASVAPLLELSLLRHVLSILLQNASVKSWVAHSDVYLAILGLLRTMTDSSETRVVALFMDPPSHAGNGRQIVAEYGISRWAKECVEASSHSGSHGRLVGSSHSHEKDNDKNCDQPRPLSHVQREDSESLYSIIEGLDSHRMALIDMRKRIHFPPTVEKLWGMADGLMYLVLQGLLL